MINTMKSLPISPPKNTSNTCCEQFDWRPTSKPEGAALIRVSTSIWAQLCPWKVAEYTMRNVRTRLRDESRPSRLAMMLPKHVSPRKSCAWRIQADKSAAFPLSAGRSKPAGAEHINGDHNCYCPCVGRRGWVCMFCCVSEKWRNCGRLFT